ncbi:MAG: DNA mismatch repair protein MutS, partial [Verrucomicrobia bacterium]|nr:DNA mismatch repair protein MutS [Verrucomicrobiota bacterium]
MSDTPMMQQYQSIRRTLPEGTLLLFRLGDFYELFFEDAKIAAPILNVALTKRNGMPMCGVPFHAAEGYVGRLIKAGLKVAICDQISEPQPGRIVERQVSQIISPGTVSDFQLLETRRNNFLAAVGRQSCVSAKQSSGAAQKEVHGLALLDISTGEFRVTQVNSFNALEDELARFSPSEVLVPDSDQELIRKIPRASSYDSYTFELEQASYLLREQFCVQSLDGFGCSDLPVGIGAAGAIVHYLRHQLRRRTTHIRSLGVFLSDQYVAMDVATQQNLELIESKGAGEGSTLLAALDRTVTPMGGRLFRQWLLKPLRSQTEIRQRQELIQQFLDQPFLLSSLRETLIHIRDVERTVARLSQLNGNPRDIVSLRVSLESLPELKGHLASLAKAVLAEGEDLLLNQIAAGIPELPELVQLLTDALVDEPPGLLKEGGIFREGYDPTLDELRSASRNGKDWIAALQQREIERTGIKSLKVRFNSVFGYFIEISNSNLAAVPADYTRKQTTVGGERFITPELKEVEFKILGADERSRALEYELFLALRDSLMEYLPQLQEIARFIGILDVVASLAETARLFGYSRPAVTDDLKIYIRDGRHPVLDQNVTEEKFVPNDCSLDGFENRLLLITGPNMAGKS